jgi:hypothetical protein
VIGSHAKAVTAPAAGDRQPRVALFKHTVQRTRRRSLWVERKCDGGRLGDHDAAGDWNAGIPEVIHAKGYCPNNRYKQ